MKVEQNLMSRYNYFDTMSKAQKGYARLLEPICKKWNLTRNELDVMLFLHNNPGFDRAADIVQNRGLSKSHVSLSINSLESRGLLLRRDDPSDRRTVHLSLTEQAVEIAEEGRLAQKRFFSYLHQGVTQEQIDLMVDFARKVSENIKNIEEVI
jgi:MarR family transcriptional regulator for hemolysin